MPAPASERIIPLMWLLLFKKTVTLLALVGPVGLIPFFLQATDDLTLSQQRKYAKLLGITWRWR